MKRVLLFTMLFYTFNLIFVSAWANTCKHQEQEVSIEKITHEMPCHEISSEATQVHCDSMYDCATNLNASYLFTNNYLVIAVNKSPQNLIFKPSYYSIQTDRLERPPRLFS